LTVSFDDEVDPVSSSEILFTAQIVSPPSRDELSVFYSWSNRGEVEADAGFFSSSRSKAIMAEV